MMLPQLLVLLAAVGGTALLLGGGLWLWSRVSRLEEGRRPPAGDRRELSEEVESLEEELASTRRETRDLSARVDFLERLLEAGDGRDRTEGADGLEGADGSDGADGPGGRSIGGTAHGPD